jgi:molecular chaperone DnaK
MKVNYGIYLGLSSASIAKMEDGIPVILRSDTLKDKMPVCIYFNRRGSMKVGDSAFNAQRTEITNNQRDWSGTSNDSFVGFTRTLGTDSTYYSTNANKTFTSTELVAEIIKTLISFEKSNDINEVVITVPNSFKINQIDDVRKAGELAGLQQVEILQESVAASMTYGLDSVKFQGYSLVFSFDDVFDVSLMKNNGIIDTEGDNYLGCKNLDYAIVDEIILPYIKENFVIDSILADYIKKQILRNSLQFYAEEAKKKLAYNEKHEILTDYGEIIGEDDEGEEIELDIAITQTDITKVLSPVFQKAIDISEKLLERNNLSGSDLDSLALVGGSTLSPVLRKMLEDQICKPDTSIDPKTAIVKGASLYASTINVSLKVWEQKRDKTKIQLEIGFESISGDLEEFITLKISEVKTDFKIPEKVFAQITRGDKCWSSGKVGIDTIGEVVEVILVGGKTTQFEVTLFDEKGKQLFCEPNTFSIIQGIVDYFHILPYNIGTELKDKTSGRIIFRTITGLEKSKQLPASGAFNYTTLKAIRPGIEDDYFEISIYQGEYNADGTRIIYNHHVNTILITGSDLPSLLPEKSEVNIVLNIDINQKITGLVTFPHLAYTYEFECDTTVDSVNNSKAEYIEKELKKAKNDILNLKSKGIESADLDQSEKEIEEIENHFNKNEAAADTQQQTIENLRKTLITIDKLISDREWPKLEKQIKEKFYQLEKLNNDFGDDKSSIFVSQLRNQIEIFLPTKDLKSGNELLEEIKKLHDSINKSIDFNTVEDLLYELTADEKLDSSEFKNYLEQLSDLKENKNINTLNDIYKKLKEYA